MDSLATLGLEVRSEGVDRANRRLDELEKQSRQTERATDRLRRETERANTAHHAMAKAVGAAVAAYAGFRTATAALDTFISATATAQAAQAQLVAGLKSTNAVSGQTVAAMNKHAAALQNVTTYGDEVINGAQALMLTFTKIGGETFPRATEAVLDMSARLDKDLKSSVLQVGKALNDPILGVSALAESGIQFTEAQKEMVKALVASNDMLGAQSLILDELESQFGGSAKAARETLGGALDALGDAWGDLFELSGSATERLRLAIESLITAIKDPAFQLFVSSIGEALVNAMTKAIELMEFAVKHADTFAAGLVGVGTALTVTLVPGIVSATAATGAFTLALATNPLFLFAAAVGAITAAFVKYKNTLDGIDRATMDAVRAYEANQIALDDVTAKTEGYTTALRNQIAMQVKAAKASLTLADAEWKAAKSRADAFSETFGGLEFAPLEYDWKQKFDAANKLDAAYSELLLQLAEVDSNMKKVETSTGGASTATAKLGNDTKKTSDELKKSKNATDDLARSIEQTLGGAFASLFDGPITDLEDALDRILGSFASLGQQNLNKLFDGVFSPANDNGSAIDLLDPLSHAVKEGAAKGTQEGATKGLMSILGKNGNAYLSAGIGGLGVGYETQNPLMGALGGAAQGFMAGGPVGAVIGGVAGLVGGLFGMAKAVREAQEKLEGLRIEVDQFNAAARGETVSKYAKILSDATTKANEYIKLAEKARDTATALAVKQSLEMLPSTLAKELEKEINASINSLKGNDYLNEVAAAQDLYNQRLKDAELLGVDASLALDEFQLSIVKIATESELTKAQLDGLRSSSTLLADALANVTAQAAANNLNPAGISDLDRAVRWAEQNVADARAELVRAYEAEETALQSAIDATQSYFNSLQKFRDDLMLDNALSPFNPFERMQTAQAKFQDIAARAINGDQDALGRLEDVSRDYLNEARDYYGTSETYFSIFGQVKGVLDQSLVGLEAQLTEDQKQLIELQNQSSLLQGVNTGIMSVADAIANLANATGMLADAQSTYDKATGFSDQVVKLYKDVLGRSPDAAGAAYWQSRIDAGVSGTQLIHNFMSGVQSGDTITASAIAKYGLPGYADGTMFHPGGLAWVGEQGKELVNLPRGAQVIPHDVSMRMGSHNDNGQTALLAEVRALREEVKALRETTAAGASMVATAASGTTNAVDRQTEEQKRVAGARIK